MFQTLWVFKSNIQNIIVENVGYYENFLNIHIWPENWKMSTDHKYIKIKINFVKYWCTIWFEFDEFFPRLY